MIQMAARWEGIPEMQHTFNAISQDLTGDKMRNAVEEGAKIFRDEWKNVTILAYLPPPAGYSTGRYRRSIHLETGVGTRFGSLHEVQVKVIADALSDQGAPYPFFLEYGTVKMSPKPSMRPAFDAAQPRVIMKVRAEVKQLLERHAKGIRRW